MLITTFWLYSNFYSIESINIYTSAGHTDSIIPDTINVDSLLGTFGIVDYTNYDDMKYAVSEYIHYIYLTG